jgi:GMP synthase (glutamine-hydrolysing)
MILVVDFGGQTAHLIGRRLRSLGVEVAYADPKDALGAVTSKHPKGVILSGGPASVYAKHAPTVSKALFARNSPVLGICYGWQLMAHVLGGEVRSATHEYGPETIHVQSRSGIFNLPKKEFRVIMSHGDSVTKLPAGFKATAHSGKVPYTAVAHTSKKLFGVQFHPEADHTQYGDILLRNFALACGETLRPQALDPNEIIASVRTIVGDQKVIAAVSGGVDSTVASFLIGKAIGKRLIPVYVDSGFMRPGTEKRVRYIFTKLVRADLIVCDARKKFLQALKGIVDPEKKRKAIGKLYIDIFEDIAAKHKDAAFLAQGTIYSDVIESKGSTHASKIKSHHNVGGLPKHLKLTLLEPVRQYYKDEVRALGRKAGLPPEVVNEQPFPGPGYAVRIRGAITPKRLAQVKLADGIVVEEMKKANLYHKVFQCFAVMTGAYSTAVKGDGRVFAEVVGVRAYESRDIMTSQWADIPYNVLARISSRIVNEVADVSRVVYDITTKPPATMEWE